MAVNTNHDTSYLLHRLKSKGKVLMMLEHRHPFATKVDMIFLQFKFAYNSLQLLKSYLDGPRGGDVDHLTQNDPIVHLLVEVGAALLDVQPAGHPLVSGQVGGDPVREGRLLLQAHDVDTSPVPDSAALPHPGVILDFFGRLEGFAHIISSQGLVEL